MMPSWPRRHRRKEMDMVPEVPLPPGDDLAEVRVWAVAVMASFGLREWTFAFTRGKRILGVCRSDRRTIGLSIFLVRMNAPEAVRDTLLHEVAHALTPGH